MEVQNPGRAYVTPGYLCRMDEPGQQSKWNGMRRKLKRIFDAAGNEKIRLNFLQAVPFWIASLLTGLMAVFYSRLFLFAESATAGIFQQRPWTLFIITPVAFLLAWWTVQRFAPYARGSGIPQVMAAIELANPRDNHKIARLLSIKIIFVKVISSFFMVLGGGLIGREGPTIQIAGSIFRKVNQLLPAWWPKISKKNMIMTGAAAGLAAAFNTPLGGIVFTVEEMTKTHISYFKTALFTAVIIAGLTAQALFGPYLYLGYPVVTNLSGYIFLGVALVALLTGLGGSLSSRAMLSLINWKNKLKKPGQQAFYVVACGLVVALIAFVTSPGLISSGKEVMTSVLFTNDKYLPWYAPLVRISGALFPFPPARRVAFLPRHFLRERVSVRFFPA